MPCLSKYYGAPGNLAVVLIQNAITGQPDGRGDGAVQVTYSCYINGAVVTKVSSSEPEIFPFRSGSGTPIQGMYNAGEAVQAADCPQLVAVHVVVYSLPEQFAYPYVFTGIASWDWSPLSWTTDTGGWVPATSVNGILPPGVELPISCNIDNSGADIVEVIQHTVVSIINWVPCMVIPVGWDRAALISQKWNTGSVAEMTDAYRAAVPSGIACGPVDSIPFFTATIALDTCQADFAPSWVKFVVGWVIVLGTATLIVRRIFWSVGSRG